MIEDCYFNKKKKKIKLFHDARPYIRNRKLILEIHKHKRDVILNKFDCIEIIESLNKILDQLE